MPCKYNISGICYESGVPDTCHNPTENPKFCKLYKEQEDWQAKYHTLEQQYTLTLSSLGMIQDSLQNVQQTLLKTKAELNKKEQQLTALQALCEEYIAVRDFPFPQFHSLYLKWKKEG